MYVRKYHSHELPPGEEHLNIPENYGGNAFKHIEEPPPCSETEHSKEDEKESPRAQEKPCAPKKAELLPVLLSILLSENREHEDIATILLFLLLL